MGVPVQFREHLTRFKDVSATFHVLTTTTTQDAWIPGKANHTIYIRRITIAIVTDAAQTISIQDSASTPVVFFTTKSSPGAGVSYDIEFGDEGVPATEGKDIDLTISAAGLAATVYVEAYMKQSSTCVPSQL